MNGYIPKCCGKETKLIDKQKQGDLWTFKCTICGKEKTVIKYDY